MATMCLECKLLFLLLLLLARRWGGTLGATVGKTDAITDGVLENQQKDVWTLSFLSFSCDFQADYIPSDAFCRVRRCTFPLESYAERSVGRLS
jgi:hypothetical protein